MNASPSASTELGHNTVRGWVWIGLLLVLLVPGGQSWVAAQGVAPTPTPPSSPLPALLIPEPPPTNAPVSLSIGLQGWTEPGRVDSAIQLLLAITLLSLAPSIVLLMTCFTRIVIVLAFVRSALSLQGSPANQIIIGLSLFLTFFIMAPVWERINTEALTPYRDQQLSGVEAWERAETPIREFMLRQTRPKDVELFVSLAGMGPTPVEELPLKVVVPGFIVSELRTAFQMGFLLFVPFILVDLVVATVLMSMGMFMMPPVMISLPLKLLLFVLADGWNLVVRSVVLSFAG
jgi:flagellar biosynthesis protein FliP